LTIGAGILESFNVRATYYVAMGLMNTENAMGRQFCHDDLHSLVERGHEVAIHGFDHISARKMSVESLVADVGRCESILQEWLPEGVSRNFAYPYGQATLAAKRQLGPRMASSRGAIAGLNGPEVDLNLLRANSLHGDIDHFGRIQQLILENTQRGSWLIFFSHDVADQPSLYGCTPALLRHAVQFAINGGARVLTVADVVKTLCPAA
jgi:peptidoglycan/xylan/chitin deacetylase (PgdA/CDA1 family)